MRVGIYPVICSSRNDLVFESPDRIEDYGSYLCYGEQNISDISGTTMRFDNSDVVKRCLRASSYTNWFGNRFLLRDEMFSPIVMRSQDDLHFCSSMSDLRD